MDFNDAFIDGPAPPPFLIGILQICFQTISMACILLSLRAVIMLFSDEDFRWSDYIYFIQRSPKKVILKITDLPFITEELLQLNKRKFIIVALNNSALEKCKDLCMKFKKDNLLFCRIGFLSSATITEGNQKKHLDGKDVSSCYDMLAISPDGTKWSGMSLNKKEEDNDTIPSKILNLKQADYAEVWCLQLLCGKTPWKISSDVCIPIKL